MGVMDKGQSREGRASASFEREPPDRSSNDPAAWLAAPALAVLAVVCCAGPLLAAALAATGAATWVASHGYPVAAVFLLGLAALLIWAIRRRIAHG